MITQKLELAYDFVNQLLGNFLTDIEFVPQLHISFGQSFDVEVAKSLIEDFVTQTTTLSSYVEIREAVEINGANGAFAGSLNKIFLAQEFVENYEVEAIAFVLLEELGHYLDYHVNPVDAPGDEGAIFAALVQGESLTEVALQQLQQEDDWVTVVMDGVEVAIEQDDANSQPTFTSTSNSPFDVAGISWDIAVGDVDQDGDQDIIAGTRDNNPNNISILFNDGSGNFVKGDDFGPRTTGVEISDFNEDGTLDIVVAIANSSQIAVLLGNGDGSFASETIYNVGSNPQSVAVGDVNQDQHQDIVVANGLGSDSVSVLLGDGTGNFTNATEFAAGNQTWGISVGDFNGDGNLDIATSNGTSGDNDVTVFLGDGLGNFGPATHYQVGSNPLTIIAVDIDGNGLDDIVTANLFSSNVSILLANSSGGFEPAKNFDAGSNPRGLGIADFNNDGLLDIAVGNSNASSETVSVLLGKGNAEFEAPVSFSAGIVPFSVEVEDFNGDGKPDIATGSYESNQVAVLLNSGNLPQLGQIHGYKWNDLDGDGVWDEGEEGLEDWIIFLDTNNNNELDEGERFTQTDENGAYWFMSVAPGSYTVAEVVLPGWEQTAPTRPALSVDLKTGVVSGDLSSAIDFMEQPSDSDGDGYLESVVKVDFASFDEATVTVEYDAAPTGFSVNIGDSATNNGYGGDSTQRNNAEMQIFNGTMTTFGNDYSPTPQDALLSHVDSFASANSVVEFEIGNESLGWNSDTGLSGNINSEYLYALDEQPDEQGSVNSDVYIGLNRTIGNGSRLGAGASRLTISPVEPASHRVEVSAGEIVENINFGNRQLELPDGVIRPSDLEALGFEFLDEPVEVEPGVTLIAINFTSEQPKLAIPSNLNAANTTNTDKLWKGGGLNLELDGANINVGVWEAQEPGPGYRVLIDKSHGEFGNRVSTIDTGQPSNHATFVAGTIGAFGRDPLARGMANQVNIYSYDSDGHITELNDADSKDIYISNHSYNYETGWGAYAFEAILGEGVANVWWEERKSFLGNRVEDRAFGKYSYFSSDLDQVLFNNPYLLSVWSAGNDRGHKFKKNENVNKDSYYAFHRPNSNTLEFKLYDNNVYSPPPNDANANSPSTVDGYDTLPAHETIAKNHLVVGAIEDITVDPYDSRDITIANFSSWGPTDDGRIKPDVVANGVDVYSTLNGNSYGINHPGGTSFAAPSVTGTAALLYERARDLNLFAGNIPKNVPKSATMKGLLIHTARDVITTKDGNAIIQGLSADGPDYQHGWGVVDASAAANFLTDLTSTSFLNHLSEKTYIPGQSTLVKTVRVSQGNDLKTTIAWTDPAGPPHGNGLDETTPVIVNNLDLWVKEINSGKVFYPWTLDPLNPSDLAKRDAPNDVDNVEQVWVRGQSPELPPGYYEIHVGHSGSITNGSQDYSLLISGIENDGDNDSPCDNNNPPEISMFLLNGIENIPTMFPRIGTSDSNLFTDPDGDDLTYTATLVNGNPLPSWLEIVEDTTTPDKINFNLVGPIPNSMFQREFQVKLVATDSCGATASQTFFIQFKNGGVVVDGAIAGATLFFDANQNGIIDDNEPFTFTNEFGNYNLDIPDEFDTNNNGQFDPEEGTFLAIGGIDTSHGTPLSTPVTAIPGASVVTLLSSLVADLVDQGLTVEEANQKVIDALSLPSYVDVNQTNPIEATNNNLPGGVESFGEMVKVQNFITQTMGLISGASNLSNTEIVPQIIAAITSEIQADNILNLAARQQLESLILDAGTLTNTDLSSLASQASQVMVEANQQIDDLIATTEATSLEEAFAKVQKVALGETTEDLTEAGAGTKAMTEVVAENTGSALDSQIASAQVLSATPTDIILSNTTIAEEQAIGTEVGTFSTVDPDTGETHTYSLVPGFFATDNDKFEIVNNVLKTTVSFDYETQSSHSIRVQTSDGNGGVYFKDFTINIADVNEIVGTSGRNILTGTDSDDLITGMQGADTLRGNLGDDKFVYTRFMDAGDRIKDFTPGEDQIVLTDVLKSFGYNGSDPIADGYIKFGSRSGHSFLMLDVDGSAGSSPARTFALVENVALADLNSASNFVF